MTPLLPAFTSARFADIAQAHDRVYCCDLFSLCDALPDQSIDMILADLPYGTTACAWDTVIPFEPMWTRFKRVIKPRGAIVLTASQPFTSALVMSNPAMFKYSWVWVKNISTNFGNARRQPMRSYEDILVFNSAFYYPVGIRRANIKAKGYKQSGRTTRQFGKPGSIYLQEYTGYPNNVLYFNSETSPDHPTQKPVALFRYLIRTYTQPGDTVLDPVVGSGTTALAAKLEQRHYVCGEMSPEYVAIAQSRLSDLPRDKKAGDMVQKALFEVPA